jgi:glycosyltransferase involved in cell wall biosynthesis
VAVVIPCYRVREKILDVIRKNGPECTAIYVVDDKCPDNSGLLVKEACDDPRVSVIWHEANQGVGGAVTTGFIRSIEDGMDIAVKIDGDGQMDPRLIPNFIEPIIQQRADYTKGNRFFNIEDVKGMPKNRLIGNAALSFMTKLSSGYWSVFDPTNGYIAVSTSILQLMNLNKIAKRYFFESDMLFRLNTVRARVLDIPMKAIYADEKSNLNPSKIIREFLWRHTKNTFKRLFYNYFLRDFSIASFELMFGLGFLLFGISFGLITWAENATAGVLSSTGTVMLSALPIILGIQLLLSFFGHDVANSPSTPIHPFPQGSPHFRAVHSRG